ncbi:capsid protein [Nitratireductor sp. B36]|uniref:capsid protein n=1 Tax=Nitratireductor sp. B36 TaxID=2762059 RepID=UPI001E34608C|nr:capsid protein [Nitratireductor sp. B36]MCC5780759.1 capsid protein [Nitratireductor sp. B36]
MNRPFPTDPTLTAIAIGYRNPAHTLIGRRALPPLPVLSESFKWTEFPLGERFTVPETEVGRKGRVNQVEFTATEKDASVRDYGLDDAIPFSDIREAARARAEKRSKFDPRAAATEGLTDLIELGREIRAAAVVQDPENYAADKKIALAASDQFDNYGSNSSDPYGVIDEGMDKTLVYRPNHIVMGQPAWSKLKRHPRLIKAVKGGLTEDGAITKAQFADLFEIEPENVLIGAAFVNAAKKGKEVSLSRVWGKSIQLLYLDPSKRASNDNVITWGFTAEYGGRIAGSQVDKDIGLEGGERVRVGERVRELTVAKDVGYLIQNAVS